MSKYESDGRFMCELTVVDRMAIVERLMKRLEEDGYDNGQIREAVQDALNQRVSSLAHVLGVDVDPSIVDLLQFMQNEDRNGTWLEWLREIQRQESTFDVSYVEEVLTRWYADSNGYQGYMDRKNALLAWEANRQ